MNIFKLIKQGLTLLETALFSRYSNPEKYQKYVIESGRQVLAEEVALVILDMVEKQKSTKLKVLDVAAGTGLVSKALLDAGYGVVVVAHEAEGNISIIFDF